MDLNSGLTTLMEKEHLLAFFRFQLGGEEDGASGLCTVTVPIKGASHLCYVTLCFLSETPEDTSSAEARRRMDEIKMEQLKSRVPEIQDIAVSPVLHFNTPQVLRQLDVYLEAQSSPTRAFLERRLIPALAEVIGIKVFELSFWKDPGQKLPAMPEPAVSSSGEAKSPEPTLIERLRTWLRPSH